MSQVCCAGKQNFPAVFSWKQQSPTPAGTGSGATCPLPARAAPESSGQDRLSHKWAQEKLKERELLKDKHMIIILLPPSCQSTFGFIYP